MNDVTTIAAELKEAQADLDLYQRLTSAPERVERLTAAHQKATAAQAEAEAAEAKAAYEARFNGLRNIRIETVADRDGGGILRMGFNVTWTALVYDMYAKTTIPRQRTASLASLPADVLAFLIERHPKAVPAEIMELAPGNPAEALSAYFRGLKRGYITRGASA